MPRFKVGVQFEPQHCSVSELRDGWRRAEELGVDSIWTWDHFFPLSGDPDGRHFEGWSLLAAMACDTVRARIGLLVSCNSYRSPDLVADIGSVRSRAAALEPGVRRIKARLARLNPPPIGPLPLMIGGEGERVTLRVAAEHADMWTGFGPVSTFAHKSRVLDQWCEKVGRDPSSIERSVLANDPGELDQVDEFAAAGAQEIIVPAQAPFDLNAVEAVLRVAKRSA